jgi:hypothetical protein
MTVLRLSVPLNSRVSVMEVLVVDAEEEVAVVVVTSTVSRTPEKVVTEKETRRSADPSLATNVDRKVTSPESAPTLLLRALDVVVELKELNALDMVVELELRDTEKLVNATLPETFSTKAEIRPTEPVEEDVEAVKKVLLEEATGMTKELKEKLMRKLPLTSKPKALLLSKEKRPLRNLRLNRSLKKSTKILRPCLESLMKST